MKHKFLHYFEGHLVYVVMLHGLKEIVRNRLTTERIVKWALEFMGLDIMYIPKWQSNHRHWRISWWNGRKPNNCMPQ
jgi:hypothetical protein